MEVSHSPLSYINVFSFIIRPSLMGCIMVQLRPSVCLSGPCRLNCQLQDLKLGTFDQHDERKNPIVLKGQRSRLYYYIVGKCCRLGTAVSSRIIKIGTIDHHDKRKMPIIFQGQRSKVRVVLSHSRKMWVGRIQTEP